MPTQYEGYIDDAIAKLLAGECNSFRFNVTMPNKKQSDIFHVIRISDIACQIIVIDTETGGEKEYINDVALDAMLIKDHLLWLHPEQVVAQVFTCEEPNDRRSWILFSHE